MRCLARALRGLKRRTFIGFKGTKYSALKITQIVVEFMFVVLIIRTLMKNQINLTFRDQLKKHLTGLTIPQEYVCVDLQNFENPLSVFLLLRNHKSLNVTASHLFLGYKPLIIGLPFDINDVNYIEVQNQNKISLCFKDDASSVAKLELTKIGEKTFGNEVIFFYAGELGTHSFLNPFHQWVNHLREKLRKQAPNNVSLPGNLGEQVRIAYSTPRIISIITTSDSNKMNMFPTDLHGAIGKKYYAGSLRKNGRANEQVEKYGQIVISEVEASFYKQAYTFGRNHMQELQPEDEFQLHTVRSKNFNFPLPSAVISYRELKRINSFDYGIHLIHLYEVVHEQVVQASKFHLAHIHQFYAQWRIDTKLKTNYLLR
jgi:flavin reductase (DIM6/NTAB) family NADH-FMN oxidoreductase RutF